MDRLREMLRNWAPEWVAETARSYRLTRLAKHLQRQRQALSTIDQVVTAIFKSAYFCPNQVRTEVSALLREVERLRPRTLLEIGSATGGTLFLFAAVAAPDARLLSLDINLSSAQLAAYPLLPTPTQRLTCLKADSHDPRTLAGVTAWLGGDQLDFLFIDGDHTLAGVAADYQTYAPLVRPQGLIGFHDIVPDYKTRHGRQTSADAGDVPEFWRQVKAEQPEHMEFVEDPEQDGAGIGAFRRSAAIRGSSARKIPG